MHFTTTSLASCLVMGVSLVSGQYADAGSYGTSMPAASDPTHSAAPASAASSSATSAVSTILPSGAASAGAAQASVHVVKVSNAEGKLVYEPADIKAAVGDMVQYHFYPKNHSIVQSTFDQPCQPLEKNLPGAQGIFSGYMPVSKDDATMPTFTIKVKNTKPIWFYCSQGKHCQSGMVGVINAPAANTSRTLDSFKALAMKATDNISPSPSQNNNSGMGKTMTSVSPAMSSSSSISSPSASSTADSNSLSSTTSIASTNTGGPPKPTTNAAPALKFNGNIAGAGLMAIAAGLML